MDNVPVPQTHRLWKSKADFFRPFRSAANSSVETISPLYNPNDVAHTQILTEPDGKELRELNASLETLVDAFPDVHIEVLRDMLERVGNVSRAEVVAERLLARNKKEHVGGRGIRMVHVEPVGQASAGPAADSISTKARRPMTAEDKFRGETYRSAVKQLLYQEFRTLSHSTIKGVMAENNYSYTLSRPTLQQLTSKAWRFPVLLPNFWSKKTTPVPEQGHPALFWRVDESTMGASIPAVRLTGSAMLDRELHKLFVAPVLEKLKQDQVTADLTLASQLNETEAEEVGATFECECCYSSVPFESLAACDDMCHLLCFECVRRTTHEALYGQGWARSAHLDKSTLRCFAPTESDCYGAITRALVQRALQSATGSDDIWSEFQRRLSRQALSNSGMLLRQCPHCDYAEIEDLPKPKLRSVHATLQHVTHRTTSRVQVLLLAFAVTSLFFFVPILVLVSSLYVLLHVFPPFARLIHDSYKRVHDQRRLRKFRCLNPTCAMTTCTTCFAAWQDPHTCFSSARTSLRTLIETSATSAIKRTCPKCNLSFVKASGCNKLVCNCGYIMCYICRCEITAKEGYGHFCQHFRPMGGKCSECERCELYGDEDEEGAIRRAVEGAEREWMQKNGEVGGESESEGKARRAVIDAVVGRKEAKWWEQWLDEVVDVVVEFT